MAVGMQLLFLIYEIHGAMEALNEELKWILYKINGTSILFIFMFSLFYCFLLVNNMLHICCIHIYVFPPSLVFLLENNMLHMCCTIL